MAYEQALQGVASLTRQLEDLKKIGAGSSSTLRGAVRAGMTPALKEARNRIPVGTRAHKTYKGRLVSPGFAKRSLRIVVTTDKTGNRASALLGPSKEAYYATQFVEVGTSKMAAKPWLRPAFFGTATQQKEAIRAYLLKAVTKVVEKK